MTKNFYTYFRTPNLLDEVKLTYRNQKRKSPHVTTRMMKRANLIIQTVKENKVIDDAYKLQKLIIQVYFAIYIFFIYLYLNVIVIVNFFYVNKFPAK